MTPSWSTSRRKLLVADRPSLLSGLLRENIRVIDWLRREYPGEWVYHAKRFPHWQSKTHEACMFSHIADAERDLFQSYLHVYEGVRAPGVIPKEIRQYAWSNPYFGD